jgi:UDP-GlcNAc:undecaprenyl-phosphate GlcNAc-1-phosphate transferase
MIDEPDFKRRIHTKAVPRGGGLGMLVAFAAVSAAFFSLAAAGGDAKSRDMLKLLAPLTILLPLGILDDRRGLRARTKFLFQTLAALVAWLLGFRLESCLGFHFPVWLGLPLTLFWIVAFINAFNMIDGVDGLAAGIGIISAV